MTKISGIITEERPGPAAGARLAWLRPGSSQYQPGREREESLILINDQRAGAGPASGIKMYIYRSVMPSGMTRHTVITNGNLIFQIKSQD